ncbi:hypothetical protein GN958_ATG22709 [Phytophthora infestans]|uniref:Uncharacterized protein n=1 Tax=Phytophthora infestans TaxID=4787 RepID=A0A8S9TJN3_PHYIN|nr:hypothetical protein GN958_ATG22709 [Phytophthora infestans]
MESVLASLGRTGELDAQCESVLVSLGRAVRERLGLCESVLVSLGRAVRERLGCESVLVSLGRAVVRERLGVLRTRSARASWCP